VTTAGKRIHRIVFHKATETTDNYGAIVSAWTQHTEAFAEVLFGTGAERREAAQTQASQAATFIVPTTPKVALVTEKDRIIGLSATWNITSAISVGRDHHFTAVRSDAP
jgi:SPP1 family predicted phage head-tail adaptor